MSETHSGTYVPGNCSRNDLSERFYSVSTDQTLPAASYRNQNFNNLQSLQQSSTFTDNQQIEQKIVIQVPRKQCDRLLGRKCPPEVIRQTNVNNIQIRTNKVSPISVTPYEIPKAKTGVQWQLQSAESLQNDIFDVQEHSMSNVPIVLSTVQVSLPQQKTKMKERSKSPLRTSSKMKRMKSAKVAQKPTQVAMRRNFSAVPRANQDRRVLTVSNLKSEPSTNKISSKNQAFHTNPKYYQGRQSQLTASKTTFSNYCYHAPLHNDTYAFLQSTKGQSLLVKASEGHQSSYLPQPDLRRPQERVKRSSSVLAKKTPYSQIIDQKFLQQSLKYNRYDTLQDQYDDELYQRLDHHFPMTAVRHNVVKEVGNRIAAIYNSKQERLESANNQRGLIATHFNRTIPSHQVKRPRKVAMQSLFQLTEQFQSPKSMKRETSREVIMLDKKLNRPRQVTSNTTIEHKYKQTHKLYSSQKQNRFNIITNLRQHAEKQATSPKERHLHTVYGEQTFK